MGATAEALTFEVDRTDDATVTACTGADNDCTLRGAITNSNASAAVDDQITFKSGLSGTITLGGTQLSVTDYLKLLGPGAGMITVSGAGASRVLLLTGTGGEYALIDGLTLLGGSSAGPGGAIRNIDADLEVNSSVISGNTATMGNGGGIYSDGPLRVKYSEVSGNIVSETGADGGGIAASGATLYIGSTMISGNTAVDNGGGVYSDSPTDTTIRQSTLSGNNTTSGSGDGGGIYLRYSTGPHLIHNSTITGNTAGDDGGGIYNYGNITPANRLSLQNSTVAGNIATDAGGGLFANFEQDLRNSILADNSAAGGPDA